MRSLAFLLLIGCAEAERGDTCDSGGAVSWEGFADGFFATYCRSCHSVGLSERYGAPEGVDFDTEEQALAQAARVRARVLEDGDMPPGGGAVEGDLVLLERWLACGG